MPRRVRFPFLTLAFILGHVVAWLVGLDERTFGQPASLSSFPRQWVYLYPWHIWSGGYWALLTSDFVHVSPISALAGVLQLMLDLLGLWVFGRRVEAALGHAALVGLLFFGALVASAANLVVGAGPGLGASGTLCALPGLMLAARKRHVLFAEMFLVRDHVRFVMGWLMLVVTGSLLGLFPIHPASHAAGWLFGLMAGYAFVVPRPRRWAIAGLGVLAAFTICSLTWMPWLAQWRLWKFDRLVRDGRTEEGFDQVQALLAREAPGPDVLNTVAWILATSRNDAARDPERATAMARQACSLTRWLSPGVIDTLAAAYAESGRWRDALIVQRLAVLTAEQLEYTPAFMTIYEDHLQRIAHRQPIRD